MSSLALPLDVPRDHWAASAVEDVVKRGWLQGYPDGTFRGELALDRYQLATTLARVLTDSPLPTQETEVRFKDVKPSHWALPGIRRMVGEGLVQGFPDQTFRGASVLTRYQLAVVLDKLVQNLGIVVPAKITRPDDLAAGHWAEAAVLRVIALDVLPLGSDGLFRGVEPVNRYQMARALWRMGQLAAPPQATAKRDDPRAAPNHGADGRGEAPLSRVQTVQPSATQEGMALAGISAVPLPAEWSGVGFQASLAHIGQAQSSGRAWATFKHKDLRAIGLLRLEEKPVLEAFYPLKEAVAVSSEGWAWLEGGQKLMHLDFKTQKARYFGPIGQNGAREALPPVFALGVEQGLLGGVALDESRNYLALINGRPVCLSDCSKASGSTVLRLVLLGLNPDGLFAEYAYMLEAPNNRVVGLAWPKPRLLLVHEHDGQTSRIYAVDLNQADDLAFTEWDSPESGLELRPQVKPLPKRLVLEVPLEQPYGLAVVSPNKAVMVHKGLLRLSLEKPLW